MSQEEWNILKSNIKEYFIDEQIRFFKKGGGVNPYRVEVVNNSHLIQGDCLEVMQWLIDNDVKVDAIITDPPYG